MYVFEGIEASEAMAIREASGPSKRALPLDVGASVLRLAAVGPEDARGDDDGDEALVDGPNVPRCPLSERESDIPPPPPGDQACA